MVNNPRRGAIHRALFHFGVTAKGAINHAPTHFYFPLLLKLLSPKNLRKCPVNLFFTPVFTPSKVNNCENLVN